MRVMRVDYAGKGYGYVYQKSLLLGWLLNGI